MTPPLRDPRLLVVSLGDRALRGAAGLAAPAEWPRALGATLPPLVDLIAAGFRLVVTPGGAPRPGATLPGMEARESGATLPLDIQGAAMQGSLGYAIAQVLGSLGRARGLALSAVTVVTRVVVDPEDPAFGRPSRPVGLTYPAAQARRLERARGWTLVEDPGRGFRRVVPGPRPRRIVEADAVRCLVETGIVPIVAGGGGVPVIDAAIGYQGVEAVLDPDLTAALLATALVADRLLFLTEVDQVQVGFGTPRAIGVERLTVGEARALLGAGEFPAASMGPKVEAAIEFVEAGGREAIITAPDTARAALDGQAGTRIVL